MCAIDPRLFHKQLMVVPVDHRSYQAIRCIRYYNSTVRCADYLTQFDRDWGEDECSRAGKIVSPMYPRASD